MDREDKENERDVQTSDGEGSFIGVPKREKILFIVRVFCNTRVLYTCVCVCSRSCRRTTSLQRRRLRNFEVERTNSS